jgi:hypothetical protein
MYNMLQEKGERDQTAYSGYIPKKLMQTKGNFERGFP